MTAIRIAYLNWWKKGSLIAKSSEQPAFPAEDTQNESPQFFWRSATGTGAGGETVDVDLGQAVELNYIALLNHNITAAATEIKAYGADDSAFTTNVVSETLTWAAGSIFQFFSTARTKRYWRVKVINATNPATYIQIGPIFLTKYFQPNRTFVKGYTDGREDFSEVFFTDSMVITALERPRPEARSLPFNGLDDTSKGQVNSLLNECGLTSPFIICLDYAYPNTNSYLVRLDSISYPVNTGPGRWDWVADIKGAL